MSREKSPDSILWSDIINGLKHAGLEELAKDLDILWSDYLKIKNERDIYKSSANILRGVIDERY